MVSILKDVCQCLVENEELGRNCGRGLSGLGVSVLCRGQGFHGVVLDLGPT
jgi:hypothetical protein